jgi:D-erythronate 2-dehydrogenase
MTQAEQDSPVHVLVTGAAGMIGTKLLRRLATDGAIAGRPVASLTLLDAIPAQKPVGFSGGVAPITADLTTDGVADTAVAGQPGIIFHLAGVVSGEAEADFEKGYRVNLDGTRALFEAIRRHGSSYRPRVVYTSSIAVYGAPFPDVIPDDFMTTPQTCYGTQKVIGELLLADYTRRGMLDGIGLRLPNICIRPGRPNKAASGFFSNILREPLVGQEAVLPVKEGVRMWHASPRAAVGFLLHAAAIDLEPLDTRRSLMMPGVSATVAEQIAALRRVAGEDAVARIVRAFDPAIDAMFATIPGRFDTRRAAALGFRAETSFDDIVMTHIEDELGGSLTNA